MRYPLILFLVSSNLHSRRSIKASFVAMSTSIIVRAFCCCVFAEPWLDTRPNSADGTGPDGSWNHARGSKGSASWTWRAAGQTQRKFRPHAAEKKSRQNCRGHGSAFSILIARLNLSAAWVIASCLLLWLLQTTASSAQFPAMWMWNYRSSVVQFCVIICECVKETLLEAYPRECPHIYYERPARYAGAPTRRPHVWMFSCTCPHRLNSDLVQKCQPDFFIERSRIRNPQCVGGTAPRDFSMGDRPLREERCTPRGMEEANCGSPRRPHAYRQTRV